MSRDGKVESSGGSQSSLSKMATTNELGSGSFLRIDPERGVNALRGWQRLPPTVSSMIPRAGVAEKALAIPAGLEPATRGVEIRYSIQLSYGTVLRLGLEAGLGPVSATAYRSSITPDMKNPRVRQV